MTPFELDVSEETERAFIRATGELDLATADKLEQRIASLLEQGRSCVILDLRPLTFIDSAGIRVLICSHQRARELGAVMQVILGEPPTRRALEITGVIDYLDIIDPIEPSVRLSDAGYLPVMGGSEEKDVEQLSSEMEHDAEELERRHDELGEQIEATREDWQQKRSDPGVPGAVPDHGTEDSGH